jgi:hypothetical protein
VSPRAEHRHHLALRVIADRIDHGHQTEPLIGTFRYGHDALN